MLRSLDCGGLTPLWFLKLWQNASPSRQYATERRIQSGVEPPQSKVRNIKADASGWSVLAGNLHTNPKRQRGRRLCNEVHRYPVTFPRKFRRKCQIHSLLPYSLTAWELGKREDVKQKALRIADLLLAGLRPRRTAPNPREK